MAQGKGHYNLQAREIRIPELDGIRGTAIGLVLLGHFSMVVVTPGTPLAYALVPLRLYWTGVDLFFVLSGFLIGGILLDARGASNYFRVFYTRRFFRIVPIYTVLLVATVIVVRLSRAGYIGNYRELYTSVLPWPFFALFLQNIGMCIWHDWGTFPLGVTWSLAVEEQFYLTLPLLIRLFSRNMLLRFIAAGVVAAPLLRIWFYHHDPESFFPWYTLLPSRMDALLLGVLGAVAVREPRWKNWLIERRKAFQLPMAVLVIGVALLGWKSPSHHDHLMASVGFTWLDLTYLFFLIHAILFTDGWISRALRWKWLRQLGTIAYGAYIFHQLFLGLFFGRYPWIRSLWDFGLSMFTLAFTFLFCRLSWLYFERPLIRIGHKAEYILSDESARQAAATSPASEIV